MVVRSRVAGCGAYLPQRIITNAELAARLNTSDDWIAQRTGIRQRHIAADGEFTSDLATAAAEAALKQAGMSGADIDLLVLATTTPDHTFPATATQVQARIGMTRGAAFDIQAVCSGFVYALATADNFIKAGQAKTALVIGAETFSRILDWNDRGTCVLFGDGAGARRAARGRGAGDGRRSRRSDHASLLRRAVLQAALCRWRPIGHAHHRPCADGRARGLPSCGCQNGRSRRCRASPPRELPAAMWIGWCPIRPICASSTAWDSACICRRRRWW